MNQQNEEYITSRLAEIKRLSAILETEETAYNACIETVREEYAIRTADTRSALDAERKKILSTLKRRKKDIFPEKTDRVEVRGGILIRHIAPVVRKARHIKVDFLRALGMHHGIHEEPSVDWKVINTWPDDELTKIGTKRSDKETFAYELTEVEYGA